MTLVRINVYRHAGLVNQQARGIHPKMFQCWHIVFDAGPTLKQHWVNALCLLGTLQSSLKQFHHI